MTFFICASMAAVTGPLLIAGGFAANSAAFDASLFAILAGTVLASVSVTCIFAHARSAGTATGIAAEPARIEDFKDAQWRLSDRTLSYRQLLDAQRDFIIRHGSDGRVVFANAALLEAFDLTSDEVLGSPFRPRALRSDPVITPPGAGRRTVQLIPTRIGKRWIVWDETEIAAADGQIEIQSVGRDITIERGIEESLKEARDRAETASREKSRFLAAMSHEIRTPMSGIIGMIGLLRDTDLRHEQKSYVRIADESARALMGLLDDILDLSKIEAGKIKLTNDVFSLKDCIEHMIQLMMPEATAKSLTLTSEISGDIPEWVSGDKMRLRQIILNLLSNAIKFTDAGRVAVHVSLAAEKSTNPGAVRVAIEVSDSGIGFPPDAAHRLFEEFEQGESATHRNSRGTGLGLAISKRLAEAMSGEIIVSPADPDSGATFTALVELRVAASSTDTGHMASDGHLKKSVGLDPSDFKWRRPVQSKFNVLVAEDDPVCALLARKVIERAGGEATVVADGRSVIATAWEALERRRPAFDLVLMDVSMPEMNGIIAAKSMKALYRDRKDPGLSCPPIVALTANAFAKDRELCLDAGMDDYLAKPFDTHELHNLLLRWTALGSRAAPPAA